MTSVPDHPLLAPWCRVLGDGDRLLLEYAQSLVVLEGAAVRTLLPELLPLLDGRRDVDEIVERLGVNVRPAIDSALDVLAARGLLVDGPDAARGRALAAAHGIPPAHAAERLRTASVAFAGGGPLRFEIARLLDVAGIGELTRIGWKGGGRADLTVVVPAHDEYDHLPSWNRSAFRSRRKWMLVRPFDGRFASAGPLVVPGQTCCYQCLLLRRGANSGYGADIADVEAAPLAAPAETGFDVLAAGLAAHVVVRFLAGGDTTLPGTLFTLEARPALSLSEHFVLRVPRCPVCSPAAQAASPLPWHQAAA